MRILVYSHDTFGMGNIRRMLAISRSLLTGIPQCSILLLTGSPLIHNLRPDSYERLDYVKLPCLTRTDRGVYESRSLDINIGDLVRLRSELILAAVQNYKPDLLLVDKKPRGVRGEITPTLEHLRTQLPRTRKVLILRDILDRPEVIITNWEQRGHYDSLLNDYDRVLILGQREHFNPLSEYRFPSAVAARSRFCGYLRRDVDAGSVQQIRMKLGLDGNRQRMLLITPGGGADGFRVIEASLAALASQPPTDLLTVVVSGPEMPTVDRERLKLMAESLPLTRFIDFSHELPALMAAADLVISMAGYNTVCEILSLQKRAIVVPRVTPTEEQWLRAERLAPLGYFTTLHPNQLTPELMRSEIRRQLALPDALATWSQVDLGGLEVINSEIRELLGKDG